MLLFTLSYPAQSWANSFALEPSFESDLFEPSFPEAHFCQGECQSFLQLAMGNRDEAGSIGFIFTLAILPGIPHLFLGEFTKGILFMLAIPLILALAGSVGIAFLMGMVNTIKDMNLDKFDEIEDLNDFFGLFEDIFEVGIGALLGLLIFWIISFLAVIGVYIWSFIDFGANLERRRFRF